MADEGAISDFISLEYERLKEEQLARIAFRDNIVYATFAAVAAAVALASGEHGYDAALLFVPIIGTVMGLMSVDNDRKVTLIGEYIRNNLRRSVEVSCGKSGGQVVPFEWENFVRDSSGRAWRKIGQLVAAQLTFVGTGLSALGGYLLIRPEVSLLAWCGIAAGVALSISTAVGLVATADIQLLRTDLKPDGRPLDLERR